MKLYTEIVDRQLRSNSRALANIAKRKPIINLIERMSEVWGKQDGRFSNTSLSGIFCYPGTSDKAGYDPFVFLEETIDQEPDFEEVRTRRDNDGDIKTIVQHTPTGETFDIYFMFSRHCKIIETKQFGVITKRIAICQ